MRKSNGQPRAAKRSASTSAAQGNRRHHWLVSGKVLFILGGQEEVSTFEHNTVITNTDRFVTANMIGEAQQSLQLQLFQQAADPHIQMINVHIQAVNYLGEMSKEQFYTPSPADASNDAVAGQEGGTSANQELPAATTPVGKPDPFANPAKAAPVSTPE